MHCNRGLGGFRDDPARMLRAIEYLLDKGTINMSSPLLALLRGQAPAAPATPVAQDPAAPPAAVAAAPAVAAPVAPAANPQSALEALIKGFALKAGVAPTVNPPEAAKVLATKTAAEVAGAAEPNPDAEPETPDVEPPTSKPAALLEAESQKRARRSAAVVQAELDIANERILELEAGGDATALQEELALVMADKEKAYARADGLQTELDSVLAQIQPMLTQLTDEKNRLAKELEEHLAVRALGAGAVSIGATSTEIMVRELSARGYTVKLEVPAS